MDPFGWSAATLEWLATYLLLWPEDGRMKKEEVYGVYDGSAFYERPWEWEREREEAAVRRLARLAPRRAHARVAPSTLLPDIHIGMTIDYTSPHPM
jgi:hypothetical protein